MRRPFGRVALPTERVGQGINKPIIWPAGEAQQADAVARYARPARKRCDDERIRLAPPVGMGCAAHLAVAEQQGFRPDPERFGETKQPGRQRLIRQWRNACRQRPRCADDLRIEKLNLVDLIRRHVGAPWEE